MVPTPFVEPGEPEVPARVETSTSEESVSPANWRVCYKWQSNILLNEMILVKSCLHGRRLLGKVDEKREAGMALERWRRRCCGLSRGTKSE
jgi:hypothetical protein